MVSFGRSSIPSRAHVGQFGEFGDVLPRRPTADGVPRFPGVEPRGLGTPYVESLTGYLQRLANEYVVPPARLFLDEIVPVVRKHGLWTGERADLLIRQSRAMDGAETAARRAVDAVSRLSGRSDLGRCTYLEFMSLNVRHNGVVLVRQKRWCPCCWAEDASQHGPYERKLWSLSVVDTCPIHSTVLVDRCFSCGRQQPSISSDVRPGICALCGGSLGSPPVRIGDAHGSDGSRRLWFAREAAALIHAVDVAHIQGFDGDSLAHARKSALQRLSAHIVQAGGPLTVVRQIENWTWGRGGPRIEEIFSALWRARWPIVNLFPAEVRAVVELRSG